MIYICPVCRCTSRLPYVDTVVCSQCYQDLSKYKFGYVKATLRLQKKQVSVMSVFHYKGVVRELMLNAKVGREWGAVAAAQFFLLQGSGLTDYMAGVRRIIPAPSSVWSRARGKYDLAFFLADALRDRFAIPMYQLPRRFYWRMKKQSMIPREFREKHGTLSGFVEPSLLDHDGRGSLLIIDDIMTTGSTIASIINHKNLKRVKVLTLASAHL